MNKSEFIKAFADKANFTQKDAGIAFDAMVSTIVEALKKGEKIAIAGFGSYELKSRAARKGINPLTKKAVNIINNGLNLAIQVTIIAVKPRPLIVVAEIV